MNLTRKFSGISRWQIQQTLREMERILRNKTDGKYPHRELMRWTKIALRDLQHTVEERAKVAKLLEKPSLKIVSRFSDGKSAAANDKRD